jgi:AcrR family transcriptional regulator
MSPRLTADERREEVIAAATVEFAAGGFAGTATEAIARRAGVSQPYVFQLFRTKKDLFLDTVRDSFARITQRFEESAKAANAAGLDADQVLEAMGHAYIDMLVADRDQLRLQLHAYAACSDPQIQGEVRAQYLELWETVARLSGADADALYPWFASGMLINVIASIGDAKTLEGFKAHVHGGSATVQ